MNDRHAGGRGSALLVGLLLTVTVSLLALSLLLGTAERQRRRSDPLGVETLLQADGAARSAQLDLAAPGGASGPTGGPPDGPFETRLAPPVLVGLSRGRGDLRSGAEAGWGEVWEQRVAARRAGESRGRGLSLRLGRSAVPPRAPVRVAVAAGRVVAFLAPDPAATPAWESPGSAAAVAPAAPEGLYLRAGLAGYEAFRRGPRAAPLAFVPTGDELRALDGATGRPLFSWRGAEPGASSMTPFVGDAVLGAGPCPLSGALGPGCAWRTIVLAGVGRSLLALDSTSGPPGASSLLWRRDLDATVTGAALGRLPRENGEFGVLVTAGNRLLILDLVTGRTLGAKGVPGGGALSPPAALDLDGDSLLDALYAADDGGRLWRFDLTAGDDPTLRAESAIGGLVERPPAVLLAGVDPETGEDRLSIAWASARPGGGVSATLDTPSRSGEAVSRPAALALDAPRLTACRELGPARAAGWSLGLRPRERVTSSLVVLDGFLHFASDEACAGESGCPPGRTFGRLYRLDALNGDPCRGASCCGRSAADSIRGAALGGVEPERESLGTVQVVPDGRGRPTIVVARAGGRPLAIPAEARPSVLAWREAPGARW